MLSGSGIRGVGGEANDKAAKRYHPGQQRRRPPAGRAAGHPEPRLGRRRARHGRDGGGARRRRMDGLCRLVRRPDGAPAGARRGTAHQAAARVEKPCRHSAQRRRSQTHHPPAPDRHRACAQPRAGMERVVGRARDAPPLRDDIPQRLRHRPAAEALVQFGDGARRAGHRDFAIRRRARRQHLRHRPGPAARHPARRRSRGFRSASGSRRPRRGAGAAMAGAGRRQDRDAARAADALEGRARLYRGSSPARPPRSVLLCWSAPSSGPASAANSKPRSSGSASSACFGLSITAPTCRRPTCCRMSSSRPRTSRRGSAASSSRRRRWAVRSSRPITAAPARRSCPASPAGSPHRAIRPRWRTAIGEALALDDEARSAFARRAMSHIAAGFTSELMCARTIDGLRGAAVPAIRDRRSAPRRGSCWRYRRSPDPGPDGRGLDAAWGSGA